MSNLSNGRLLAERLSNLHVLVVGDVMLDRYLQGKVGRISPEAPVPVVEQVNEEDRLGGAANVALNLRALGATPVLCGVVGKDADATPVFQWMADHGLSAAGLLASSERVTTVKTRIIADHQHLLRLDRENTQPLSSAERRQLLDRLDQLFADHRFDVLILQDYNKGVLSPPVIEHLLHAARQRGIPVAVDPKFHNFWNYVGVDLLKPNLKEIRDVLKRPVQPEAASLQAATTELRQRMQQRHTLVTLSHRGCFLENGQRHLQLPTKARNVADVCGAGDAVVSVAAAGLALGFSLEEIGLLSNLAGGQVVEKLGVVPVDLAQLLRELEQEVLAGL